MSNSEGRLERSPCPFYGCFGAGSKMVRDYLPTMGLRSEPVWFVECECCKGRGPARDTVIEAIAAWNNRVLVPDTLARKGAAEMRELLESLHAEVCEESQAEIARVLEWDQPDE